MAERVVIHFEGDLKGLRAELNKLDTQVEGVGVSGGKKLGGGLSQGFKDAFTGFTAANFAMKGIDLAMQGVNAAIDAMLAKEDALADFSALTGVTGAALGEMGRRAEDLAVQFGGDTVSNIEAFKGVLSRLGPGIAQNGDALAMMGENINILSKASGLDATESMDALTTAMLQFNVSLDDPIAAAEEMGVMMNVMAAAAKEGAAEIPDISAALKQVGATAKSLNVSFVETNALLQSLATGGKTGSEAGVALRNVLSSLVTATGPGNEALKRMGLTVEQLSSALTERGANEALKVLSEGLGRIPSPGERAAAIVKLFGKENQAAAQILVAATRRTDEFAGSIDGTNTALDQANIKMATTSERWGRFTSFLEVQAVRALEEVKGRLSDIFAGFAQLGEGDIWSGLQDIFDPNAARMKRMVNNARARGRELAKQWDESLAENMGQGEALNRSLEDLNIKLAGATGREALEELRGETQALQAAAIRGSLAWKEYGNLLGVIDTQIKNIKEDGGGSGAEEAAPIAGSLGAMATELKGLEDQLTNKLLPGSAAFDEAARRARNLRAEIEVLSSTAGKIAAEGRGIGVLFGGKPAYDAKLIDDEQVRLSVDASVGYIDRLSIAMVGFADITANTMISVSQSLGGMLAGVDDAWKSVLKTVGNTMITAAEGMLLAADAALVAKGITTFGLSLITDAPLIAAGYLALELARGYINSLDVGGVLTRDQLIMAHAGETVIPFREAPAFFAEAVNQGAGAPAKYRQAYKPQQPTTTRAVVQLQPTDIMRTSRMAEIYESQGVA